MLTVARPRPVACATSLAVSPPSYESALSTLVLVAPDRARVGVLAALAARVRAAVGGGFGEAVFGAVGFAAGCVEADRSLAASAPGVAEGSRGSSARSARRSLSASANSWSSNCWMSCLIRSITRCSSSFALWCPGDPTSGVSPRRRSSCGDHQRERRCGTQVELLEASIALQRRRDRAQPCWLFGTSERARFRVRHNPSTIEEW